MQNVVILKNYLLRDFATCVYLSEAHEPHIFLPLYTLHTCKQYTYSHRRKGGRGGGEVDQREGEKSNSSQSWVENTNMTKYISSPDKHLLQSPLTGQIFFMTTFCFGVYLVY